MTIATNEPEDFYTIDQTLEKLSMRGKNAARTLHRWRKEGRVKSLDSGPGRRVRLEKKSVDALAIDLAQKSSCYNSPKCQVAGEADTRVLEAKLDDVMAAVQGGFGNMIQVHDITAQRDALAIVCTRLECELVAEKRKAAEPVNKCIICETGKLLDYVKRIFRWQQFVRRFMGP